MPPKKHTKDQKRTSGKVIVLKQHCEIEKIHEMEWYSLYMFRTVGRGFL